MRHPRITVVAVAVALAAAVGGVTIASASDSSTPGYPTGASMHGSAPGAGSAQSNPATVQTATATVHGVSKTILVDANGLPLYTYQPDTSTTSRVSGQLAALWPPLVSGAPTARGATGTLRSLATSNGKQVTYNGHFLYTFVEDGPGRVTGQGVQNFFVATPDLSAAAKTTPTSTSPSRGYGY